MQVTCLFLVQWLKNVVFHAVCLGRNSLITISYDVNIEEKAVHLSFP